MTSPPSGRTGDSISRCPWASNTGIERDYHDREWGVPLTNREKLFEFLILEGAQAGLSWSTVLKKRDHYRKVFDHFVPEKVATYSQQRVDELLLDPGIIRNRLKVEGTVRNAKAWLAIESQGLSVVEFLWSFVGGKPIQTHWKNQTDVPSVTPEATTMSRELKKKGFTFVGPTICYAFMQATGMVNDHTVDCFRHREVKTAGDALTDHSGLLRNRVP